MHHLPSSPEQTFDRSGLCCVCICHRLDQPFNRFEHVERHRDSSSSRSIHGLIPDVFVHDSVPNPLLLNMQAQHTLKL